MQQLVLVDDVAVQRQKTYQSKTNPSLCLPVM